ncbi:MAG: guanylate kinase [Coriobacteriia bacterium]
MRGKLFIISGPSGAGKGTLVKKLLARVPELSLSVSATTRTPRPGEVDGVDYRFLAPGEFDARVGSGDFLEWAEVHGNRYGTLRSAVEGELALGKTVILEIDPQGAFQVSERMPEAVTVFIVAPSREELARRIRQRGAETEDQVATRLETAERELSLVGTYDYVVMNDDVLQALRRLEEIVVSP